jgi:ABC-2 type transport system ATP-binding protein
MSAVIEVWELSRRFGSFEAVKAVSFEVRQGEIFGFLGANGAGKSTTIRMLCGLLAPSGGQALVAGHDVGRDPESVRMSVGYMSQRFSLYPDLTSMENLDFFGGAYRIPRGERLRRARTLLEQVGLAQHEHALVSSLPGGMRQRLALAAALLHRPAIVFLDEPTAGVDPGARRRFWRIIRGLAESGTTVFVTTHYMDEAEYCGRVGLMVDGRLVALDAPSELKRRFVPGRLVLVRGNELDLPAVRAAPGVWEAHAFGAGLHVRGDPGVMTDDALLHVLDASGARQVTIEDYAPTLEDVFLAVARASGDDP